MFEYEIKNGKSHRLVAACRANVLHHGGIAPTCRDGVQFAKYAP